jgi:hypothetical protein
MKCLRCCDTFWVRRADERQGDRSRRCTDFEPKQRGRQGKRRQLPYDHLGPFVAQEYVPRLANESAGIDVSPEKIVPCERPLVGMPPSLAGVEAARSGASPPFTPIEKMKLIAFLLFAILIVLGVIADTTPGPDRIPNSRGIMVAESTRKPRRRTWPDSIGIVTSTSISPLRAIPYAGASNSNTTKARAHHRR